MQNLRNEYPVQKNFADHSRTSPGYTYFVRHLDLIKIGHSGAPAYRFRNLERPRQVLAIAPHTLIDEPTAHKKFAHLRVKGEWFQAAPDLLAFIDEVRADAAAMGLPANLAKLLHPPTDEQRSHIEANIRKQMADLAIRHQ